MTAIYSYGGFAVKPKKYGCYTVWVKEFSLAANGDGLGSRRVTAFSHTIIQVSSIKPLPHSHVRHTQQGYKTVTEYAD